MYGLQLCVGAWVHAPVPLQCDTGWYVEPPHDVAAPQTIVFAACWQPPFPLHAPVFPHGGLAAHCPVGALAPDGMLAHVPRLPARLHALHVPQLPELQQTPSTHAPLVHSRPAAQASPSDCLPTQLVPLQ